MVPGSTLMYGSNFIIETRRPRSTSRRPSEAAAIPLPSEETTPPVTKMYLVVLEPLGMGSLVTVGVGDETWIGPGRQSGLASRKLTGAGGRVKSHAGRAANQC